MYQFFSVFSVSLWLIENEAFQANSVQNALRRHGVAMRSSFPDLFVALAQVSALNLAMFQ